MNDTPMEMHFNSYPQSVQIIYVLSEKEMHMKNTRKKKEKLSAVDIKEAMQKKKLPLVITHIHLFYDVMAHIYALDDAYLHILSFVCAVSVEK